MRAGRAPSDVQHLVVDVSETVHAGCCGAPNASWRFPWLSGTRRGKLTNPQRSARLVLAPCRSGARGSRRSPRRRAALGGTGALGDEAVQEPRKAGLAAEGAGRVEADGVDDGRRPGCL